MRNFTLDIGGDGIALIAWDMPGKSMNVIDETVMDELERIAGQMGRHVIKVYKDHGISGAKGRCKRPASFQPRSSLSGALYFLDAGTGKPRGAQLAHPLL